MKNKKFVTALIIFLVSITIYPQNLYSQSDEITSKYWFYRYRLKSDFMVVGEGRGKSLPASKRNQWGESNISWGDNTIHLGWYIGVLATEYELIIRNPQEVQSIFRKENTLTELYYALKCLERLDLIAEEHPRSVHVNPNYTVPTVPNGFVTRDDVDDAFFNANQAHWDASTTKYIDVDHANSDWKSYGSRNHELSLDQVVHLLMGLKIAYKLLPHGNLNIRLLDGSTINFDLKNLTKTLAVALINNPGSYGGTIKNLRTGDDVKRGEKTRDVHKFLKQIKDEFLGTGNYEQLNIYGKNRLRFLGNYNASWSKDDNRHIVLTLNCITKYGAHSSEIKRSADEEGWTPFYELLNDFMDHPYGAVKPYSESLTHLVTAPCSGPSNEGYSWNSFSFPTGLNHSLNWHASNRYLKDEETQRFGFVTSEWDRFGKRFQSEAAFYNGLDYMLLHNLYLLKTTNPIGKYYNQINYVQSKSFWNSQDDMDFFDNATFNDAIAGSSTNFMVRSTNEVNFKPGFHAERGIKFSAYINPMNVECHNQRGIYRTKNPGASTEHIGENLDVISAENTMNIKIYPNPSIGIFNVEFEADKYNLMVVKNNIGQTVKEINISSLETTSNFDLSIYPGGLYFVSLIGNETRETIKITKQ